MTNPFVYRFLHSFKVMIFANVFAMIITASGEAQNVPQSKLSYKKNEEYSPAHHPLLGNIKEQTPLLAPSKGNLFAPPLTQNKQAQQKSQPQSIFLTVANFPLNESLLTRLEKIHKEILELPETNEEDNYDDIIGGVDVLVKALEKRPDIMGVLGQNLISAHDYVTAMQAVSAAFSASSGTEDLQTVGGKISPDNLAFGKKYANRIRALLEE